MFDWVEQPSETHLVLFPRINPNNSRMRGETSSTKKASYFSLIHVKQSLHGCPQGRQNSIETKKISHLNNMKTEWRLWSITTQQSVAKKWKRRDKSIKNSRHKASVQL